MSYCRWSSDSYRSDLLCFRSGTGFETHVARLRRVLPDDLDAPDASLLHVDAHRYDEELLAFTAALDLAPRVSIGLEHDGAVFVDDSENEMFERVAQLADAGYRVPSEVLDVARSRTSSELTVV